MPATNTAKKSGRKRRLGRGLQSLMNAPAKIDLTEADNGKSDQAAAGDGGAAPRQQREPDSTTASATITPPADDHFTSDGLRTLAVDQIVPNPYQPRGDMDESALDALASSIASAGMMQPIVVRPSGSDQQGERFQLIAGERRWRAAGRLGLKTIPAVVRSVDDQTAAEWALVENLQREDLNPLERAEAFKRLNDEFSLTHEAIAEQVGLNRASVSNHLRLLELDDQTKQALRDGRLTMGHARALLAITNEESRASLGRRAIKEQWSVRRLEQAIRTNGQPATKASAREPSPGSMQADALAKRIGEALGTSVHIQPGKKKGTGKLTIDFYSFEQFEGVLERLGVPLGE